MTLLAVYPKSMNMTTTELQGERKVNNFKPEYFAPCHMGVEETIYVVRVYGSLIN